MTGASTKGQPYAGRNWCPDTDSSGEPRLSGDLSLLTGIGRKAWEGLADSMLLSVRPWASKHHSHINLPGPKSISGTQSDGLEGFARTFLLAGFRLVGEGGNDPYGFAQWYRQGLIAGTDSLSPHKWPNILDVPQARVEAASIVIILDMTREWIWDCLSDVEQSRVIDWLAPVVGNRQYPQNNWVWFQTVVETFLRSVGGPWSRDDIQQNLAIHDAFYRGGGWFADGQARAFDHYNGWAFHTYPTLWARMQGAGQLADERADRDQERLDRFLQDAVRLVGSDGAPLMQGRSLIYRFAASAVFWVGALTETNAVPLGQLRRAASGMLSHFLLRGVPNADGLLDQGVYGQSLIGRQAYSGTASPYWAAKGMLGLMLPPDHPVWMQPEEQLPIEKGNQLFTIDACGWVVSGTKSDGVVRVVNHGTDNAHEGSFKADAPLYGRMGYSTATFPLCDERAQRNPLDQSAVLLDQEGQATHRTGMKMLDIGREGSVAYASSIANLHWVSSESFEETQKWSLPAEGNVTQAGEMTLISLVKDQWELRLLRLSGISSRVETMRLGGWPISADKVDGWVHKESTAVTSGDLQSQLTPVQIQGVYKCDIVESENATPIGKRSVTPILVTQPHNDHWECVCIELSRDHLPLEQALGRAQIFIDEGDSNSTVSIRALWPDGTRTATQVKCVAMAEEE